MQDTCVSVNLTQVPDSTTPLHIVLWKGAGRDEVKDLQIKSLMERISVLENMVNSLLETRKSSPWFPAHLRPTPTGIEVMSRRESMGAESDIGTVLSQIVRPTEDDIRSVTIVSVPTARPEPVAVVKMDEVEAEVAVEAEVVVEDEGEVAVEGEEEGVDEEGVAEEGVAEEGEEGEEEGEEEGVAEGEEVVEEEGEVVAEAEAEADAPDQDGQEFTLEEEIVEYKEVEWKGHTYYVDGQGEAYEMDADGDLNESPIGLWREATQKLVRYTKATL